MQMTMRWFGTGFDTVTLRQIRQVPGVGGVVSTLYDTAPGDPWPIERIQGLKGEVEAAGLSLCGIESVNIHDAIKVGAPERDRYIRHYITTLERLGQAGIRVICYNFMPVFDWTRSDLARMRSDGSTVLAYNHETIAGVAADDMFGLIQEKANGTVLPGWEPERMERLKELFQLYEGVDEARLRENLRYFLRAIRPVCEQYDIRMAIHPDDPPWPVFGLPRIAKNKEDLLQIMGLVDAPFNGVTVCTGSLGANPDNDLPEIIRALKGRVYFAHVRNLRHNFPGDFEESAHLSADGSLDMVAILKALYDTGFDGIIRPDHGRAIWGEVAMPGYGLYDRALGAVYLGGIWETIGKLAGGGGGIC